MAKASFLGVVSFLTFGPPRLELRQRYYVNRYGKLALKQLSLLFLSEIHTKSYTECKKSAILGLNIDLKEQKHSPLVSYIRTV